MAKRTTVEKEIRKMNKKQRLKVLKEISSISKSPITSVMTTNYNPKEIEIDYKYDPKFQMMRIFVKLRSKR